MIGANRPVNMPFQYLRVIIISDGYQYNYLLYAFWVKSILFACSHEHPIITIILLICT